MTAETVERSVDLACADCGLNTDACLSMREDCCSGCTHYDAPIDPDEDVDEVAVERAMAGDLSVTLNRKEAAEAHSRLHARGLSNKQIGAVLGVSDRAVDRWNNGHNRPITRRGQRMTDTIDALLAQAKRNPAKRIQTAAKRAHDAVQRVRDLIEEDKGKAALRERAARLEAELRAVKAEIRGTTASVTRIDTKAVRAWAEANGVQVPARGRIPQTVVAAYTEAQAS